MSDQEKLTTYGALITVFALLLIVVYAPDDYDIWDAVIGGAAVWFGLFYLLSKLGKDLFSITFRKCARWRWSSCNSLHTIWHQTVPLRDLYRL